MSPSFIVLPTQNKCTPWKKNPTSLKYPYLSQLDLRSILQIGEIDGRKKRDMQWKRNPEGGTHITQISISWSTPVINGKGKERSPHLGYSDIHISVNSYNKIFQKRERKEMSREGNLEGAVCHLDIYISVNSCDYWLIWFRSVK
jgi:hypothetical protein